jgi:O-antigen/teichoic acid export membrane protein
MHFSRKFMFFGYKRIIAFVVTMACGFAFRSYWALVAGMVTGRLAGVALSFVMQSYRPRFCIAATRDLLSFSGWMVRNNLIAVALGRVPHFFVGRILGPRHWVHTPSARRSQTSPTQNSSHRSIARCFLALLDSRPTRRSSDARASMRYPPS